MVPSISPVITVSPPNLDRTGYLTLEQGMSGKLGPTSRPWLLERLAEGFQIRMLRPPLRGVIEFAPGKGSWLPIKGGKKCVVVQNLKVEGAKGGADILLCAAEEWARYYDFSAVVLVTEHAPELTPHIAGQNSGYRLLARADEGASLMGKVLQGPMILPRFPTDLHARKTALGPGLVIQCVTRCEAQLELSWRLAQKARASGLKARVDQIDTAKDAREKLVSPVSHMAVMLNGKRIDNMHMSENQLWQTIQGHMGLTSGR